MHNKLRFIFISEIPPIFEEVKTKKRATGATESCNLLIINQSTVQDRPRIVLLSCTDCATEAGFPSKEGIFYVDSYAFLC